MLWVLGWVVLAYTMLILSGTSTFFLWACIYCHENWEHAHVLTHASFIARKALQGTWLAAWSPYAVAALLCGK